MNSNRAVSRDVGIVLSFNLPGQLDVTDHVLIRWQLKLEEVIRHAKDCVTYRWIPSYSPSLVTSHGPAIL